MILLSTNIVSEKQGMVPGFAISCQILVDRWKDLVGAQGRYELDVMIEFENLTGDIISRTAFGSNYEDGKKIFELQNEQAVLSMEAMKSFYIPGFRCKTFLIS